ncbi:AarF/UbiB family protein [Mycobacteroides sp. LB1]|uniref:ABC1 kinase family protein n=1 Tax=Mycobacteroides sp. LB1 TaxID=2750814 RepID=UPI0015DF4EC8|nr:AarF/ABC1/UbiB kinase family protein [Mycobacteroides sp. LB1]
MSEIARGSVRRGAKLASVPLGAAGRAVVGWGRRLAGGDTEAIATQWSARNAEQLFAVLGGLKGGAMKFGQMMSIFEAAIPDQYAEPYRAALTGLQASAPSIPIRQVHRVLAEQLGQRWRERFTEFDHEPVAAASIGQVHRARWHDGRIVAVKVQYPGVDAALQSDLRRIGQMSRLLDPVFPGIAIRPMLAEVRKRMAEELDYRHEAENQRTFASTFNGSQAFLVPKVVASAPKVLVTEWVTGRSFADIIQRGDQESRNTAAALLFEFCGASMSSLGLLHSDPHPGNYQLTSDGRLAVLDFGAVTAVHRSALGYLDSLRQAELAEQAQLSELPDDLRALVLDEVNSAMQEAGFSRTGVPVKPEDLLAYFGPFAEPLWSPLFRFDRHWLQQHAARIPGLARGQDFLGGAVLEIPTEHVMMFRTIAGFVGVACQLEAEIALRNIVIRWYPDFAEPKIPPQLASALGIDN